MPAEVEAMFSAREVPWHRIGTIVPDALTAKDAIVAAGLDWGVELVPVATDDDGVVIPDRFAVRRDSDRRVFDVVSDKYVPLQNRDAFAFADNLVDSGEAKYETAGALRGGRWVWLTMKMPQHIMVGGEDRHDLYLLLNSSHDGLKAITVSVTPIRVVCMNTLNLALAKAKQKWSVRHISTATQRLQEARDALKLTFKYVETFEKEANALLKQKFSEKEFAEFAAKLTPDISGTKFGRGSSKQDEKILSQMKELFAASPTLENVRGTKWAALNAVGEWLDWGRDIRTPESQMVATWSGRNIPVRNRALALLK